jgi:hypothetical protein
MIDIKQVRIEAMPSEYAERIRTSLRDDYGNALTPTLDESGGSPCRHCLRLSSPGERMLLLSYRPFRGPVPYQEVGPVFLHADGCQRFARTRGFPTDFALRPLILRPYDENDNIHDSQRYADVGEAEAVASDLLANPTVAYVHARSRTRGCYMFRIERTPDH